MAPFTPKLILVPTDFSEPAAHALRFASALGVRFAAHLLVMYADPFVLSADVSANVAQVAIAREELIEQAREELQRHAEENIHPGVPFDARVVMDSPFDAIADQACEAGADLIVMGTHGRTGLRRLLVGSVTEAVMRAAAVPVIAVNPSSPETADLRKILCAVQFDAPSRAALRFASALAASSETPLLLFRAVEEEDLQNTVKELIRIEEWAPPDLASRCDIKIVPAHGAADQIVAFARLTEADLIAIGVPEGRGLAEVLRGTIAERVVQSSGCPVLAVNAAAARALEPPHKIEIATGATA